MLRRLVIVYTAFTVFCGAVFVDIKQLPDHDLYKPGDLILAGMFPRSPQMPGQICSNGKSTTSIKGVNAMIYAIDRIMANSSLLPNISLGYVMMDDCNNEAVALMKSTQLVPVKQCVKDGCRAGKIGDSHVLTAGKNPQYEVVGLVGPFGSTLQLRTSLLLSFYEIPHISWIATSDALSDKWRYKYFSRVVPPDRFQARALVDIIDHYNWTYISTLYSEGTYGSSGIRYVRVELRKLGICTAYSQELRDDFTDEDYDRILGKLRKNYKAKVVVFFVEGRHGRRVMSAIERNNATLEFVLLSSEGFGINSVWTLTYGKRNWMSLVITSGPFSDYEGHYKKTSPFGSGDKIWTGEYTEEKLGCSWDFPDGHNQSCHRYKSYHDINGHYMTNWPARIIDATDTFGLALHSLISDTCPVAFKNKALLKTCISGPRLLEYIRGTSFNGQSMNIAYDDSGDLIGGTYDVISISWNQMTQQDQYNFAGKWHISTGAVNINESRMIWWKKLEDGSSVITNEIPESVCAKPCGVGEFYLMGELSCCWECRRCRDNEFLRANLRGCDVCPTKTWPNEVNFSTCEIIPPTFMHWSDPIAMGLSAIAGGMLLISVIITFIFIKHRQKKVIKGSNRELMTPIVIGLFLAFSAVFFFIAKAQDWICYVNYFGFNLSCTLIFGPLFLKTLRMYRIFAAAEKCEVRIRGVDSTTMIVSMFFIFVGQVVITVVVCFYQPPLADETMPVPTTKHVELSCLLPEINLLSPLCYNILLLILCSIFGFLTRKLPDNFNESWYIFISVTTTLFVWIAFLPTYFMAFYAYHKSALLGFALILNGGVTVLCLFAPKIYAVYFVDEKGIKVTNFDFTEPSAGA